MLFPTHIVSDVFRDHAAKRPLAGLIHHSDRGSQYCAQEYTLLLDRFEMRASMSRKGSCYDMRFTPGLPGLSKTSWMLSSGRWPSICSEGVESSEWCKYRERSARMQSNGWTSHETALVTDHFEVNGVAITEKFR